MKLFIIYYLLFITACAQSGIKSRNLPLQYIDVKNLTFDTLNEAEIVKKFGQPSGRVEKLGHYTLIYVDEKTGVQRLSLNFNENKKLIGYLWIPFQNEEEFKIAEAKANFSQAQFKSVDDSNSITYIDEQSGISIRYDKKNNFVEAIAKYIKHERIPAESIFNK